MLLQLGLDITVSAICKFLDGIGFTRQRISTYTSQRDDTLRRDTFRKKGYSLRGKPAKAVCNKQQANAVLSRRDLKSVLEVMALDSSSSTSGTDSCEEDDKDILLCELAFQPKLNLGQCLHIADLTELQCEQLFRY